MIIDVLPNAFEKFAHKHTFRSWQTGLLGDMVSSSSSNEMITINMGRGAGHTYFAKVAATKEFPARTKIYVTRQEHIKEFASVAIDEDKVHEPIELLDRENFVGYVGSGVEFIIIDMSDEHPRQFRDAIGVIRQTLPSGARILLMQPNFLNFLDQSIISSV